MHKFIITYFKNVTTFDWLQSRKKNFLLWEAETKRKSWNYWESRTQGTFAAVTRGFTESLTDDVTWINVKIMHYLLLYCWFHYCFFIVLFTFSRLHAHIRYLLANGIFEDITKNRTDIQYWNSYSSCTVSDWNNADA